MQEINIIVATHKQYHFPNDMIYTPIQLGKVINHVDLNMTGDDTGDNISAKNATFCELTGLYWAWRNYFFTHKYAGLVHYRRYFVNQNKSILSQKELLALLDNCDCIVPKKRNYFIENIYTHYKNAHNINDLDKTREIMTALCPDYIKAFDKVMSGKTLYLYNMFVMRTALLDEYCDWLFSILFQLEKEIDTSGYDLYQKRVFGFIAERLFNVWVEHNHLIVYENKVINLEGENLFFKAVGLLKRKFIGRV